MSTFKHFFGSSSDIFPDTAVVAPFIPVEKFSHNGHLVDTFKGKMYSGGIIERDAKRFAVISCRIGDRLVGDAILWLKGSPVKNIIFVGSCGGLNGSNIGDLLVCTAAFNGEGFTRYHCSEKQIEDILKEEALMRGDDKYTNKCADFICEHISRDMKVTEGEIFTIGSIAAETCENIKIISRHGFKGIEMELSAVYSASKISGIRAVGLLYVSDLPGEKAIGEELSQTEKKNHKRGLNEVVRLSTEFAAQ